MGFYSPATLTADARRHGVQMLRPDILRSGVHAGLEAIDAVAASDRVPIQGESGCRAPTGLASCADPAQEPIGPFDRTAPDRTAEHRRDGAFAVRLGLADVSSIG